MRKFYRFQQIYTIKFLVFFFPRVINRLCNVHTRRTSLRGYATLIIPNKLVVSEHLIWDSWFLWPDNPKLWRRSRCWVGKQIETIFLIRHFIRMYFYRRKYSLHGTFVQNQWENMSIYFCEKFFVSDGW